MEGEGEAPHVWRPMEGEGKGPHAQRPIEGEGKGSLLPLFIFPPTKFTQTFHLFLFLFLFFSLILTFYFTMVLGCYLHLSSLSLDL